MFEDSTFDSTGRIRTRSRGWMLAAFALNGSILLAMVLIPLIYPEALPRQALSILLEAPTPPPAQQPAPKAPARMERLTTRVPESPFEAPRQIPRTIFVPNAPEPGFDRTAPDLYADNGVPGGTGVATVFREQHNPPVARSEPKGPVQVSSGVMVGLLFHKTLPVYPPIAVAVRAEGTVVLQATISKTGTIENVRVVSGPPMLQQAALDAVRTWRYRPYLLNGEPVAVETTVDVIFRLGR
jgi:protein TonB